MHITSSHLLTPVKFRHAGVLYFFGFAGLLTAALLGAESARAQEAVAPDAQARAPKTAQLAPIMPVEDRLPYLRKLKAFLEADPLDMAEFERQFDVKFECRPWRSTGKICDYRTAGARWPYAVFGDKSSVVSYSFYGTGVNDLLWISLLYSEDRQAYNCITGSMVQQVFTPPEWAAQVGIAKSQGTRPNQALILALDGNDQQQRRITLVTMGVKGCTGTLQITIHPHTP